MEIVISEAAVTDAQAILSLQKLAYQGEAELYNDLNIPPLTQTLSHITSEFEKLVFLKAEYGNRLIGSVRASLEGDTCAIGRLIVHPDFQGNGIGTQLMLEIETYFSNAQRYELFTGTKSTGNIRLYQRLGYRIFREKDLSSMVRLVYLEKKP